jgi:mannose/fructose/N-acetylgalactosamine-specific phosphotransferase system component IID
MEPEWILGLSLLSLLALGLGTQLARQGSKLGHALLLSLGVISVFVMVGWQHVLSSSMAEWKTAHRST